MVSTNSASTTDTLPSSRELDALMAEKVMGWQPLLPSENGHCDECRAMIAEGQKIMRDPNCLVGVVPCYSTSIEAAWEVVEKLLSEWTFSLHSPSDNIRLWAATFYARDEKRYAAWHADTAPLAICRAALKAVGCQ